MAEIYFISGFFKLYLQ